MVDPEQVDKFTVASSSGDYILNPSDNVTLSNGGGTVNQKLGFKSIFQLYYSNYISGSKGLPSGSFENFTQSTIVSSSYRYAHRDLGENAWGTFYRVSLPLYLPGIIASLLLSFIISFDEFVLAFFLTGSDATLPMYMWAQMRFIQKLPHVLALGAVIIVFTTIIVLLAFWLRNLGQGKEKTEFGINIHE